MIYHFGIIPHSAFITNIKLEKTYLEQALEFEEELKTINENLQTKWPGYPAILFSLFLNH